MTSSPAPLPSPEPNPTRVGVGVFLLDPDGRVLLLHRTSKHGNGTWGPPGGNVDFGEDPVHAAIRETLEETGLALDVNEVHFVGYTNDLFPESNQHYVLFCFAARIHDPAVIRLNEPHKFDQFQWFKPHNFPVNLFTSDQNFVDKFGGPDGVVALLNRVLSQK